MAVSIASIHKTLLGICIFTLLSVSCKDSPTEPKTPVCRTTSIKWGGNLETFKYDNNGRVVESFARINDSTEYTQQYAWTGNRLDSLVNEDGTASYVLDYLSDSKYWLRHYNSPGQEANAWLLSFGLSDTAWFFNNDSIVTVMIVSHHKDGNVASRVTYADPDLDGVLEEVATSELEYGTERNPYYSIPSLQFRRSYNNVHLERRNGVDWKTYTYDSINECGFPAYSSSDPGGAFSFTYSCD